MNLSLNTAAASGYHAGTQIARRVTEDWVLRQMYCPRCGNPSLRRFPNNRPVADFFCDRCEHEYELKSHSGRLGTRVADGSYAAMIRRITEQHNPDFFFLGYSRTEQAVTDLFVVPRHFFTPSVIERRAPLPATARRAGWEGCNILLGQIPSQGRIPVVAQGVVQDRQEVIERVGRSAALETRDLTARGWLLDVLFCVEQLPGEVFTLDQIYAFAPMLTEKHPHNHNVKAKIRQQLQLLRDRGFVEFSGRGSYRKLSMGAL